MNNIHYGFIASTYLIWLSICACIMPIIYTGLMQLASFCIHTLDSLLHESERLSISTYIQHDSLGSQLELTNKVVTLRHNDYQINYFIRDNSLKRYKNRYQNLNQYLNFNQVTLISNSCFNLHYNLENSIQSCTVDY